MSRAWTICSVDLDVSANFLPLAQTQQVYFLDYINPNNNVVHWVASAWYGKWYQTEADCDAVIATLAGIGGTGFKVGVDY